MSKLSTHTLLAHLLGKARADKLWHEYGPVITSEVTAVLQSRHDLLAFLAAAYVQAETEAKQLILAAVTSAGIAFATTGRPPTLAEFLAPLADVEKLVLADIQQAVELLVTPENKAAVDATTPAAEDAALATPAPAFSQDSTEVDPA